MKNLTLKTWQSRVEKQRSEKDDTWQSPFVFVALEYTNFWFRDVGLVARKRGMISWQVAFCESYLNYLVGGCHDKSLLQFNEVRDKVKTIFELEQKDIVGRSL